MESSGKSTWNNQQRHRAGKFNIIQTLKGVNIDADSDAKIDPKLAKIGVIILIVGGGAQHPFRRVPLLHVPLGGVHDETKLINALIAAENVTDPLKDIYQLNIKQHHEEAYFVFTNHNGERVRSKLQDFNNTTGALADWKKDIIDGNITTNVLCNCGDPCKGRVHPPEIYELLNTDDLVNFIGDYYAADIVNEDTIKRLEKEAHDKDEEINDLKSQVTALRLQNEENSGRKRVTRGRAKK